VNLLGGNLFGTFEEKKRARFCSSSSSAECGRTGKTIIPKQKKREGGRRCHPALKRREREASVIASRTRRRGESYHRNEQRRDSGGAASVSKAIKNNG